MTNCHFTVYQGNIRVFCRVRPVLPSEVSSEESSQAEIEYPDNLDHKEIVLSSASENAMGKERKDEWQFSFDRVRLCLPSHDFPS